MRAVWYLDARIAGLDWYPEEISGLIACLRRFRTGAEEYVAAIVNDSRLTAEMSALSRQSPFQGAEVCSS
jgi:hypothetical protein